MRIQHAFVVVQFNAAGHDQCNTALIMERVVDNGSVSMQTRAAISPPFANAEILYEVHLAATSRHEYRNFRERTQLAKITAPLSGEMATVPVFLLVKRLERRAKAFAPRYGTATFNCWWYSLVIFRWLHSSLHTYEGE